MVDVVFPLDGRDGGIGPENDGFRFCSLLCSNGLIEFSLSKRRAVMWMDFYFGVGKTASSFICFLSRSIDVIKLIKNIWGG